MHTTGKFQSASVTLDGQLSLTFLIQDKQEAIEGLDAIKDVDRLSIDIKKYRERRSLDANAYAWVLFDKIAKVIGTDKWQVYLMELEKYGEFVDPEVTEGALRAVERLFRYTQVLDHCDGKVAVRGYIGSSEYDSEQMAHLIDGTVRDAKDLGIDVLTPDEQAEMIRLWEVHHGKEAGY